MTETPVASQPALPRRRRNSIRWVLWIVLAAFCFLGVGRSLWTPDEPREAEIGREMYLAPTLVPTLDGKPFYEKPPLYYWALAGAYVLARGPSAGAARAVSGAAAFATLVLLVLWAGRELGRRWGLIAAFLLVTSSQFFVSTHWVLLDPLLVLWLTMAYWGAWEKLSGRNARWALPLFYSGLILALWTKGVVGPALAAVGLLVFFVVDRRNRPWRELGLAWGIPLMALALAAVAGAIYLGGGSQALWQWAWVNHVDRFVNPQHTGHRQPAFYYVSRLAVASLPWFPLLLDLFRRRFWKGNAADGRLSRYAASIVGGGFFLLSLASTKRETYLLPLLPVLALLLTIDLGKRWVEVSDSSFRPSLWLRFALLLEAVLLVIWALAAPGARLVVAPRPLAVSLVWLLASLILLAWLFRSMQKRLWAMAGVAAMAIALFLPLAAARLLLPIAERQKSFTPFVTTLDATLPPGEPVHAIGSDETLSGIVPFLTGRRVIPFEPDRADKAKDRPAWLLVQSRRERGITPPLPGYKRVLAGSIGPHRQLILWHLARTSRTSASTSSTARASAWRGS